MYTINFRHLFRFIKKNGETDKLKEDKIFVRVH